MGPSYGNLGLSDSLEEYPGPIAPLDQTLQSAPCGRFSLPTMRLRPGICAIRIVCRTPDRAAKDPSKSAGYGNSAQRRTTVIAAVTTLAIRPNSTGPTVGKECFSIRSSTALLRWPITIDSPNGALQHELKLNATKRPVVHAHCTDKAGTLKQSYIWPREVFRVESIGVRTFRRWKSAPSIARFDHGSCRPSLSRPVIP
jgi:hypothetical protein